MTIVSLPRRLWLAIAIACLPLLGFWSTGLFDLDEGFYAAVVRDMMRRGDWITPTIAGEPWFEKPILLYWAARPAVALFGDGFGPRLPSVLAAFGTLLVLAVFSRRWLDDRTVGLGILALGGGLLFAGAHRMMLTDPLLVFSLTLCFVTFFRSLVDDSRWRWLAGAALGLAVLAKGPVGGAFFVALAGITYWREPSLRSGFRGGWAGGIAAFALIVAAWYVPAYLAEGQVFVQRFLIEQNLQRFAGGDEAHKVPGWLYLPYYVLVLLVGMAPWSWLGFRRRFWTASGAEESDRYVRYLVRWALIVVVLFTIGGSKLPHYVLPAVPALALLAGRQAAKGSLRWRASWRTVGAVGCVVVAVLANWGFAAYYRSSGHAELHRRVAEAVTATEGRTTLVAYQMPRRQADLGTGRLEIQETSHPSIHFYYPGPVEERESLEHADAWVVTRPSRLPALEREAATLGAEVHVLSERPRHYVLARVRPISSPPER